MRKSLKMNLKILSLLIIVWEVVDSAIDDKTSPNAFLIAKQFRRASLNESYTCPFTDRLAKIKCDATSPYRSFDGTCNNLNSPLLGAIETPHKRFLKPTYDDDVDSLRSNSLPNPRLVSNVVSSDPFNTRERSWTNMWTMFGQFVTHDITSTALINSKIYFCLISHSLFYYHFPHIPHDKIMIKKKCNS